MDWADIEGRSSGDSRPRAQSPLPVVDGIGRLPVIPNGARRFRQLVNARYGCASTALTSDYWFVQRGGILFDEVMAAGLPDRLLLRRAPSTSAATAAGCGVRRGSGGPSYGLEGRTHREWPAEGGIVKSRRTELGEIGRERSFLGREDP